MNEREVARRIKSMVAQLTLRPTETTARTLDELAEFIRNHLDQLENQDGEDQRDPQEDATVDPSLDTDDQAVNPDQGVEGPQEDGGFPTPTPGTADDFRIGPED